MEKPLAAAAGLGWQGKHTDAGLARLRELAVPRRDLHHRGAAGRRAASDDRAVVPALPRRLPDGGLSGALPARCAALHRLSDDRAPGPRSRRSFAPPIGNRVFGCDDCLAVCPWNKFAAAGARSAARRARRSWPRRRWTSCRGSTTPAFRASFRRHAGEADRARPLRAQRAIAIGNSGDPGLATDAVRLLGDASPLVRAMAVWAVGRLLPKARIDALAAAHLPLEADPDVRGEWARARSRCASPQLSSC